MPRWALMTPAARSVRINPRAIEVARVDILGSAVAGLMGVRDYLHPG